MTSIICRITMCVLVSLSTACAGHVAQSIHEHATPSSTESETAPGAIDADTVTTVRNYRGNATVTIQYCDIDAAGVVTCPTRKTFRRPLVIIIEPRMACSPIATSASEVKENNPFHLSISTDIEPDNPLDGDLGIISAYTHLSMERECLLMQYWTFTQKGNRINGRLSDAHGDLSYAQNILWAWTEIASGYGDEGYEMVMPYPIGTGTTLSGTVSQQQVRLRIKGSTVNTLHPFVADITATRMK